MVLINGKFDQFVNSILVDPHKNHYANVAVWMSLMDQLSCLDFFFFFLAYSEEQSYMSVF